MDPFDDNFYFVSEAPPLPLLVLEGDTFRFVLKSSSLRKPDCLYCNVKTIMAVLSLRGRVLFSKCHPALLVSWGDTRLQDRNMFSCEAPPHFLRSWRSVARYTCGCLGNYVPKGFHSGTFDTFARLGGPSLRPLRERTSMPSALLRGRSFLCPRRFGVEGL